MVIGSNKVIINGNESQLNVPAQIINGKTYVPLRTLVESLDKKLYWNNRGLIIISDIDNILDSKIDTKLIDEAISKLKEQIKGNSDGNLQNDGLVAQNGEWIYYCNLLQDDATYKVNIKDSTKIKIIDKQCMSLNVIDNWIYYTTLKDNRLYKMTIDGKKQTLLDKEDVSTLQVIDNWIYYLSLNDGILYKIKTDGTSKTRVIDDEGICNFNIYGDWIYYSLRDELVINKITIDGTEKTTLIKGTYNIYKFITKDSIFFSDWNFGRTNALYKVDLTKGDIKKIINNTYAINISGDWIYYSNGSDKNNLYKMKLDGANNVKLNEDEVSSIHVVGDWIYYTTSDRLWKIKSDGTGRTQLK